MRPISIDQSHQVVATLLSNTDWGHVDFETSALQDLVIRNPKEAGRQFTSFLQKGCRMMVANLSTFKTIKLGTLKDFSAIQKAIISSGCIINDDADDALVRKSFTLATQEVEIELVRVTSSELGLKGGGACYLDIYKRAQLLGLDVCPAEVGPQLRLQYIDQPKGELLRIAMKPFNHFPGGAFYVDNTARGMSLSFYLGHPDPQWYGDADWVFVRR